MTAINRTGHFTQRPEIGATYLAPNGQELTVAATWERGVVFEGGRLAATASELLRHYQPTQEG